MSDAGPGFETKLERIEAIVKELEDENTTLDRAIALFKEGKVLARECEAQLKSAQAQIDEAMSDAKPDDQIPF
ncbi:MAG: exodeoxyribonuclease VII small subunit [Candidatus Eremiobacteraeota bacterium]|nr:exodeoxyribonuclease VII small subunit [Candidatus Eremiobacteraeota bacterium]MBV8499510.1 exodeoxyribonuclease VII small subunit [Candidatus Eremiobacteraeota bacterium]